MNGRSSREWLVPLTGLVFVVLAIVGFAIQGESKSADDPVNEIVDYYLDNKDSIQIGSVIAVLGGVFLIFFYGYLRKVLRAAEGEGGMLSALTVVGAGIFVVGLAIDSTILFATAEAADDIEPTSVQTLQALWDNDFLPFAAGLIVMQFAAGISIVAHGALPKWLGWAAMLFAILSATPLFFVGLFGTALWIVIVSILLSVRTRREVSPPATAS